MTNSLMRNAIKTGFFVIPAAAGIQRLLIFRANFYLEFGNAFQPAACLKALTYFKDGDLGKLSGADRNTLIEAAKSVRTLPRIALRSKNSQYETALPNAVGNASITHYR